MIKRVIFMILMVVFLCNHMYADTNGVWHLASDIRGGVFGENEQGTTTGFSFMNPVSINDNLSVNGNLGVGTTTPLALLHVADIYPAGGKNILVGDDSFLTDIDVANTLGIYGNQNPSRANIKLGSSGPVISGFNGNVGIGVPNPTRTLQVAGQVGANAFCLGTDCKTSWDSYRVSCDWSGWDNNLPWQGGTQCISSSVRNIFRNPANKDMWIESGSCTTSHAKGYTCKLTIGAKGSYSLSCWTINEDHGEWMGTETNLRTEVSHYTTIGAKVEYLTSSGKWKLTSTGKENNHNSPAWTTESCTAGGYK